MTKICRICNTQFEASHGNRRICSDECRVKSNTLRGRKWREREKQRNETHPAGKTRAMVEGDVVETKIYIDGVLERTLKFSPYKKRNPISRIYRGIKRFLLDIYRNF